jgi:hypothetical protein
MLFTGGHSTDRKWADTSQRRGIPSANVSRRAAKRVKAALLASCHHISHARSEASSPKRLTEMACWSQLSPKEVT